MKLRLDIDQQYTEEQIIIEAPSLSPKIQKVQNFVQSLDQKRYHKREIPKTQVLSHWNWSYPAKFYIENRKVLAENG